MILQTRLFKIRIKPRATQFSVKVEVDDGVLFVSGNGWVRHQRVAMPRRVRFFHKHQMKFNFAK